MVHGQASSMSPATALAEMQILELQPRSTKSRTIGHRHLYEQALQVTPNFP